MQTVSLLLHYFNFVFNVGYLMQSFLNRLYFEENVTIRTNLGSVPKHEVHPFF